jgi:hypothetical protein
MNGFQHLPSQQDQRFWVFSSTKSQRIDPSLINRLEIWTKPPGISFVHIICVGGGSGAGGTVARNAGIQVGGGGGGASGAITSTFLPAYLVPDTLYISVGTGGPGGIGDIIGSQGAAGQATWVSFWPDSNPATAVGYTLCYANQAFIAGSGGSIGGFGTGGTGPAAVTTTSLRYSQIGLRNYFAGQSGANGGVPIGTSINAVYRISGGAGGGGNNNTGVVGAGGSINSIGQFALSAITASPSGSNGARVQDFIKFIATGGTGASSAVTISGSNGGFGGFGSGGGGGSVGLGGGGRGGDGGDGLVIITCG